MPDASPPPAAPAVVLDTNAALDWLVFADRRMALLAMAIEAGSVSWIGAPRMRAELAAVLQRPPIAGRPPRSGESALAAFDRLSRNCPSPAQAPAATGLVCTDVDDQVFVDLALAQKARWLITRDKALLALRRRALGHGLDIATPEGWRAC